MKRCIKSLWSSSWLSDLFSSDSWRCVWCIFVLFFMVCPIHFLPGFHGLSDQFLSYFLLCVWSIFVLVFMVCLIGFPPNCFHGLSDPLPPDLQCVCNRWFSSLFLWFVSSIFVLVFMVCLIHCLPGLHCVSHPFSYWLSRFVWSIYSLIWKHENINTYKISIYVYLQQ